MSKTTWRETFKDSPRLKAIESVFRLIERPDATIETIWAKTGKVMTELNALEREALPAFVRAELKDREPIVTVSHPVMG